MRSNAQRSALPFYQKVHAIAKKIPRGYVASYGQLASLLATPRAARIVGAAMRHAPDDVPWQRVIASSGRISIENIEHPAEEQVRLLEKDGVVVERRESGWFVDMKKFGWRPK